MAGTLLPAPRSSDDANAERRTISGERRIVLPESATIPLGELFGDADVDRLVDGALADAGPREEELIPIAVGTVMMPKFASREVVPAAVAPVEAPSVRAAARALIDAIAREVAKESRLAVLGLVLALVVAAVVVAIFV